MPVRARCLGWTSSLPPRSPFPVWQYIPTSDLRFPGGVETLWEPGGFEEILSDDTVVYPGHGDDTTVGAERPHLQEWRERGW